MYCADCGARNEAGSTFCRQCGVRLPVGESPVPAGGRPVRDEPGALERAAALRDEGDLDGAIELCRRVIVREPRNRAAHAMLGGIYEAKGQTESAIREYRVVLEIDPRSAAEAQRLARLQVEPQAEAEPPEEAPEPPPRRSILLNVGIAAAILALVAVVAAVIGAMTRPSHRPEPVALRTTSGSPTTPMAPSRTRFASPWTPGPPYPVRPRGVGPFGGEPIRRTQPPPASSAASKARQPTPTKPPQASAESIRVPKELPPPTPPPPSIHPSPARITGKTKPPSPAPANEKPPGNMVVPIPDDGGAPGEMVAVAPGNAGVTPVPEGQRRGEVNIWLSESPPGGEKAGAPSRPRTPTTTAPAARRAPDLEAEARARQFQADSLWAKRDYRAALEQYRASADTYTKLVGEGKNSDRIRFGKEYCEKRIEACQANLASER